MYCLTFFVRHRKQPVHICFDTRSGALQVLGKFSALISTASDDELVIVEDQAAFLKRAFVAVEMEGLDDDDGDDDSGQSDEFPTPPPVSTKAKRRKRADRRVAESKLEADLEQIVSTIRGSAAL